MAKQKKKSAARKSVTEIKVGTVTLSPKGSKFQYTFAMLWSDRKSFKELQDALKRGELEILELRQQRRGK